jgi:hypothetical protein
MRARAYRILGQIATRRGTTTEKQKKLAID